MAARDAQTEVATYSNGQRERYRGERRDKKPGMEEMVTGGGVEETPADFVVFPISTIMFIGIMVAPSVAAGGMVLSSSMVAIMPSTSGLSTTAEWSFQQPQIGVGSGQVVAWLVRWCQL